MNINEIQYNFKKSFEDFYKLDKNTDHKSKHWKKFYAFSKCNEFDLINFRNKSSFLSEGLDDSKYEYKFNFFTSLLKEVGYEYFYKNLSDKNVGNNESCIKYRDKYLDLNKFPQIAWLKDLEENIFSKDDFLLNKHKNIICEIGGGFGSFAEMIIKNTNIKYILIDFPEANLLSTFYLSNHFQEKKIFQYSDYLKNNSLLNNFLIEKYDIFILPPSAKIFEEVKIDLFINTRSFMEMNLSTIDNYFELIQKHAKNNGFLLNINRYEKRSVGDPIRISKYPYDENWDTIISKPSYNQPHIHFLLTQRNTIYRGDIKEELKKIDDLSKPFYESKTKRLINFIYSRLKSKIKFLVINKLESYLSKGKI